MLEFLLEGRFLTRDRARIWAFGVLLATLAAIGFLAITAHGANDYLGRPLGTDFSDVYAAGELARDGVPEAAYDPARHYRQEQAIFGLNTPFYGWHYPPYFLLVATALSNLPYVPALILWQLLTFGAYLSAMRALVRHGPAPELASDPMWLWLVLAFPAVYVNFTHGQNGFLTAALMAGGLALLHPKPVAAGVLFGLMVYKPQFALVVPVALAAGGHWKTIGAAAATVALLTLVTTMAFGTGIWADFLASTHFSRTVVLEQGSTGFQKIQSVFSAVRLLGGPVMVAYAAQAVTALAAIVGLVWLWYKPLPLTLKGAGLCLAALLATPYCLDYDLMLLAPAIALLAGEGRAKGHRSGELLVLAGLWLIPFMTRGVASVTHLVLPPILMAVCFVLIAKRARV